MGAHTFDTPQKTLDKQHYFGPREVGLSHPDVHSFIRLCDNGNIEITAGEGLLISLNPKSGSITFVADHINFITRSNGGLKWNHVSFNERATSFNEPTFIADDWIRIDTIFEGMDDFAEGLQNRKSEVRVRDEMGNQMPLDEYVKIVSTEDEPVPDHDAPDILC